MPGPAVNPVDHDLSLPKKVDVVVIGGGIIGASTALELAERGLSVLLCEKGRIGAEQSSRNWGWVRIALRDPREIPLMIEARRIWQGLDARTGRKTGYHVSGIFHEAGTPKKQADYARWAENLVPHGIDCGVVSAAEMSQLLPGHNMAGQAGLYTPGDGRAEPQWATPAIAEAARDAGAHIVTSCAVRSVDVAAGRIAGVVTERGRVACDAVVLAGGAWSRLFAGNAGVELPQLKVLSTVMRTSPVRDGPGVSVWSDGFALRRRADGGYTVAWGTENTVDIVPDSFRLARAFLPALASEWRTLRFRLSGRWWQEAGEARRWSGDSETPFERCRILDPEPSARVLRIAWKNAQQAFPALQSADIMQSWAGLIDVTPDAVPVISPVEDMPGLHIATGFSGHGFGIGPGAGRLMADLVTGATPVVDPHDFRLSRFSDGSRVRPVSGRLTGETLNPADN
ncbi:MAG: glycine/D-amino acid oxidase-like deaminating enzyme [Paracoccaceae bacterium]|jgi:glycine/D-amino acid oxidase-like deaminating enzyme